MSRVLIKGHIQRPFHPTPSDKKPDGDVYWNVGYEDNNSFAIQNDRGEILTNNFYTNFKRKTHPVYVWFAIMISNK